MVKNNIRVIVALVFTLFFPLSVNFADCPPECSSHHFAIQSMALSYDSVTTFLHVEADHHSRDEQNREVDYVNKMTVALNGRQIILLHFRHQRDPDLFVDEVMLKAKAGDVISVELFCSGGSSKQLDLTVSDEVVSEIRTVSTESTEATN